MFRLTCAALDGPDGGGGGARGRAAPPGAHLHTASGLLLFLRAAFLDGAHVAVAAHAEAPGHGQVQGIHGLRLHLAEDGLAHRLDLPVHFHLAHLWTQGKRGAMGKTGARILENAKFASLTSSERIVPVLPKFGTSADMCQKYTPLIDISTQE